MPSAPGECKQELLRASHKVGVLTIGERLPTKTNAAASPAQRVCGDSFFRLPAKFVFVEDFTAAWDVQHPFFFVRLCRSVK